MNFRIATEARSDLVEIAAYIARDNPARAVKMIRDLNAKIRAVAKSPKLYALREEWGDSYRSALHQRYHLIFRIDGNEVYFVRIVHGARDIASLLGANQ